MEKDNIIFTQEEKRVILLSGIIRDDELVNYIDSRYDKYQELEKNGKGFANKKIPIKVGGKTIVISLCALIGVLAGIGTIKKNKNKKNINVNAINIYNDTIKYNNNHRRHR